MQPAVPSWQPAFYPIILGPTNHARHLPVFGPKLRHYPDGPFSCLAKIWVRLFEQGQGHLDCPAPPVFSHLPASMGPHSHLFLSAYIWCFFFSQFHEFGVEVFYFETIHICFYAFQGFIRAFRDNRCFLVFQHCFRFLKNLQPFLELWSLNIFTSVWRIPCLWVFQREGTLTSKRAKGQRREIWGVHALTLFIFRYFDYGDINIIYVKRKV